MSKRFAVAYEAAADFRTATELADRVLHDAIDWLRDCPIDDQREWIGEVAGRPLKWTEIKKSARDAEIRVRGHFDGAVGESDARAARRAILYLRSAIPDLDAIVLVRDQDGDEGRRLGLEQARQEEGRLPVVVGLAVVERESWLLSGFDPDNAEEESVLEAELQKLGFDPRTKSHELTACKNDSANRSPKRVVKRLMKEVWDRERRCWNESSLSTLAVRGASNGLAVYLLEVRDLLAALIGHLDRKRPS